MPAPSLLNVREVCKKLGVCRSTLYKHIAAGRMPAPVHITPTTPRWRDDEVAEYIDRLSAERVGA